MRGGREVAEPCSDAVKSGTESFNCPDSENLCDLSHVNVGGGAINEVIAVTKMADKKKTTGKKSPVSALFCDGCHIVALGVCFCNVTAFTKYFYPDSAWCLR